jgi:hypothetical protein
MTRETKIVTLAAPVTAPERHADQTRGVALIVAMMAVFLIASLGASLAILTNTELRIVANYADAIEMRYAAEAALESVIQDLGASADWDGLLASAAFSALSDGVPGGQRTLVDGTAIDLDNLTTELLVERPTCRLFAFAPVQRLQPGENIGVDAYLVVWIADDPERDPAILIVRAEAFGIAMMRKAVEARVQRTDAGNINVLAWEDAR